MFLLHFNSSSALGFLFNIWVFSKTIEKKTIKKKRNEQKVVVTSYGRNKNLDDEIKKNQEKDDCAAIKHTSRNRAQKNTIKKVFIKHT